MVRAVTSLKTTVTRSDPFAKEGGASIIIVILIAASLATAGTLGRPERRNREHCAQNGARDRNTQQEELEPFWIWGEAHVGLI